MALSLFYTYLLVIDGNDIYRDENEGNAKWLPFICMNSPFILIAYNGNRFLLDIFLYTYIAFTFLLSFLDTHPPIPRCFIFLKAMGIIVFLLQIYEYEYTRVNHILTTAIAIDSGMM
jgi:hypothetical protein